MTLKEQIIWNTLQLEGEHLLEQLLDFVKNLQQKAGTNEESKSVDNSENVVVNDVPTPFSQLNFYTVDEILSPEFEYKPIDENKFVGVWPGDESTELLLHDYQMKYFARCL